MTAAVASRATVTASHATTGSAAAGRGTPPSRTATSVRRDSSVTTGPHASTATAVPHDSSATTGPHGPTATAVPRGSSATTGPHASTATAGPHDSTVTTGPGSTATTGHPGSSVTTAARATGTSADATRLRVDPVSGPSAGEALPGGTTAAGRAATTGIREPAGVRRKAAAGGRVPSPRTAQPAASSATAGRAGMAVPTQTTGATTAAHSVMTGRRATGSRTATTVRSAMTGRAAVLSVMTGRSAARAAPGRRATGGRRPAAGRVPAAPTGRRPGAILADPPSVSDIPQASAPAATGGTPGRGDISDISGLAAGLRVDTLFR